MSDRPTKLSFDAENQLHADGEPAIEFADGYNLYSCHGVTLPERWYASLPSHQLRKAWQISKGNISLRQTLIRHLSPQNDEATENKVLELIEQTNLEMERLGWNQETGRRTLIQLTGKPSRFLCTFEELENFLIYLQSQPIPEIPNGTQ